MQEITPPGTYFIGGVTSMLTEPIVDVPRLQGSGSCPCLPTIPLPIRLASWWAKRCRAAGAGAVALFWLLLRIRSVRAQLFRGWLLNPQRSYVQTQDPSAALLPCPPRRAQSQLRSG